MADVFISYAREDRNAAERIAQAIAQHGWSVWWDRKVHVGRSFSRIIEHELGAARCVVVLWSRASVESDWVLGEAEEGARRELLVPILIDNVRPPLEFRRLHTASLTSPELDLTGPEFAECIVAFRELLGAPAPLAGTSTAQQTGSSESGGTPSSMSPPLSASMPRVPNSASVHYAKSGTNLPAQSDAPQDPNQILNHRVTSDTFSAKGSAAHSHALSTTVLDPRVIDALEETSTGMDAPPSPRVPASIALVVVRVSLAAIVVALVFFAMITINTERYYGMTAAMVAYLIMAIVVAFSLSWRRSSIAYALLLFAAGGVAVVTIWSGSYVIAVPDSGPMRELGFRAYIFRTIAAALSVLAFLVSSLSPRIRNYYRLGAMVRSLYHLIPSSPDGFRRSLRNVGPPADRDDEDLREILPNGPANDLHEKHVVPVSALRALARDDEGFLTPASVVELVVERSQGRPSVTSEPLLILANSTQQTWLVFTDRIVACVLDDLKKGGLYDPLRWQCRHELAMPVTVEVHKRTVGLIHLGPAHRKWLYSTQLHPDPSCLQDTVTHLLRPSHLGSDAS